MPFFHYRQNNSRGEFKGPAVNVIIEADTTDNANNRAETFGLYFDGLGDCPCCGDRWSTPWQDEADKTPVIYGVPVEDAEEYTPTWRGSIPFAKIYYLNGTIHTIQDGKPRE